MNYGVISADNHIIEPRNLFETRLPAQFRDRAPRVVRGADGGDGWSWYGKPPERTFGIEAVAGRGNRLSGFKWEELMPGNYDGAAHLADMRKDGIDAAVVFPMTAIQGYVAEDRMFGIAVLQAYNDWLLEDFTKADPARLIGLCLLPVDDGMNTVISELNRCLKKGSKAFFLPAFPRVPYHDALYDPLWKAAAEAGVPLCLHRTFGGKVPGGGMAQSQHIPGVNAGGIVVRFFSSIETLTYMIYTGVFDRHPKLKIVAAEVNCGWTAFWSQTMDQQYEKQKGWAKIPINHLPSEVLGKNVFITTLDDMIGFDLLRKDPKLADMTMFSVDYPHSVCLWPDSGKYIAELTAGMDPAVKKKVLAGNAIRVFQLD